MAYKKVSYYLRKLHVYDTIQEKVICGTHMARRELDENMRKKIYNAEEELLAEYSNLRTKCQKCENILKSRAGIEYEKTGVNSKTWDHAKMEKFYYGGENAFKFCPSCQRSKKRKEFTKTSKGDLRSKYCRHCQKLIRQGVGLK